MSEHIEFCEYNQIVKNATIPSPKGEFTIVVRDKDTGEVKRIIKEDNIVARWTYYALTASNQSVQQGFSAGIMFTSGQKVSRQWSRTQLRKAYEFGVAITTPGFYSYRVYEKTISTPVIAEVVARFNNPPTAKTIYTIGISANSISFPDGALSIPAYASLSSPCIQGTTEILDIYYRVQFLEPQADPQAVVQDPNLDLSAAAKFNRGQAGLANVPASWACPNYYYYQYTVAYPQHYSYSWLKNSPDLNQVKWMWHGTNGSSAFDMNGGTYGVNYGSMGTSPQNIYTRYGQYFHEVNETSGSAITSGSNVGVVMASQQFGYAIASSGANINYSQGMFVSHWINAIPYNFSVVQPVHRHNSDAWVPFLDPSFLANGAGTINFNADGWTRPGFYEFIRVDIKTTGNVGVSKYYLNHREIAGGFAGNSYQAGFGILPMTEMWGWYNFPILTIPNHGMNTDWNNDSNGSYHANIGKNGQAYNSTTFLTNDLTGICLYPILTQSLTYFDSTTTPALPATDIRQVAVDSLGNIWVACGNTGLYKITNPLTAPTITLITNPTGGVSRCYGVCIGAQVLGNDTIIAVFDDDGVSTSTGGIAMSTDYGTTWPNIYNATSPIPFSYTGISNLNWQNVYKIRADKTSSTYKLGVIASYDVGSTFEIVWWSTQLPAKQGPNNISTPGLTQRMSTDAGHIWYDSVFRVSNTGSYWMFVGSNNTTSAWYYRTWFYTTSYYGAYDFGNDIGTFSFPTVGNQVSIATGTLPSGGSKNVWTAGLTYVYDRHNNPFLVAVGPNSVLTPPDGSYGILGWNYLNSSGSSHSYPMVTMPGSQMTVSVEASFGSGQTVLKHFKRNDPDSKSPFIADGTLPNTATPLNGRYTAAEDLCWSRYNYIGGTWVKNQWQDATDNSGNGYSGTRINFDTESHTFTGNSSIVVGNATSPRVATAGNFSDGKLTFAARVTMNTKLNSQSRGQVLLSGIDKSKIFIITGVTTGVGGNFRVKGNQTSYLSSGQKFLVRFNRGLTYNNQQVLYTISGIPTYSGVTDETTIVVTGSIPAQATPEGHMYICAFQFFISHISNAAKTGVDTFASINRNNNNRIIGLPNSGTGSFNFKEFGTNQAPTVGTPTNIVLTIDPTVTPLTPLATLYKNGASVGTVNLDFPLGWDNPNNQLELVVGGTGGPSEGGLGFDLANNFFKGTLQNVIIWNGVWNLADVTAHNASPLADPGYVTGGGTLRAQYKLNETLNETKFTHSTYDSMINGVTIRFNNPVSGTAFVAGDYFTSAFVDGILKDNATSFTLRNKFFAHPTVHNFDEFTPTTVPAVTTLQTDESVNWTIASFQNDPYLLGAPAGETAITSNSNITTIGYQATSGDFTLKWNVEEWLNASTGYGTQSAGPFGYIAIGFTTQYANANNSVSNPGYYVYFYYPAGGSQGNVRFVLNTSGRPESGTTSTAAGVGANPQNFTWAETDTWEMIRTGGTVVVRRNGVPIFTYSVTNTATAYPLMYLEGASGSTSAPIFFNTKFTYQLPAYMANIGTPGTFTGKYDPKFLTIDATIPSQSVVISVDQWAIASVDQPNNRFLVAGDITATLGVGNTFQINGNTDPESDLLIYTVSSIDWNTINPGFTTITVSEKVKPTITSTGNIWKILTPVIYGLTTGSYDTAITSLGTPSVNEVVFVPAIGHVKLNSAHAGKTLRSHLTVIYKEPI